MPKGKGKKGKKGGAELTEPENDLSWERTVETGIWDRPPQALPDANTWPTWGALRERVLTACKQIKITHSPSVRDAFAAELVKLSPPELARVELAGSSNLRKVVVSPLTACPKLTLLDLSLCNSLEYVLLQSNSLTQVMLSNCPQLSKVLIHCPAMTNLHIDGCPELKTVIIWSDQLLELDLSDSTKLAKVNLHCPTLVKQKIPPFEVKPKPVAISHPPIAVLLHDNYVNAAINADEAAEWERKVCSGQSLIHRCYRPF